MNRALIKTLYARKINLVNSKRFYQTNFLEFMNSGTPSGMVALGALVYASTRYHVAKSNQYLVRTGPFIKDISISKKAFLLPYQTLSILDLEPITYSCLIEDAMSIERISFEMPTVFTIGPKDDMDSLKKYAKLLLETSKEDLEKKVKSIIQGETRILAGKVSLDDLFNNRSTFKEEITDKINEQLDDFGLFIYNANIEELKDTPGNEYFEYIRKRALEGAVQDAKVAVAEQSKKGNIGERMHITETRQKLAEYEKQAKLTENERDKDIAESDTSLNIVKAELDKQRRIAESESNASAEIRQLELQKIVEEQRIKKNTEKLRADMFTIANVNAEVRIREAEGIAAAMKIKAEAEAEAIKIKSNAFFIEKENEAKGILKIREAEATGLIKLVESAGNVDNLSKYLMIKERIISDLAEQQARAVSGLNPKINILQTGSRSEGIKGAGDTINDIITKAVPMFEAIKEQYNLDGLKYFRENENNQKLN